MRQIILCSKFAMLLFFFNTIQAKIPTLEKNALVDLYTATNGNEWTTPWDLNKPVSL